MSPVSVRKLASQERVSGEKRVAVKPLLNVQCPPMSLEKVWQAILRQFWRYVRPRVNPKDGFDFNEILWSFLDQSRRWGQELQTWSPFTVILATLYRRFLVAKGLVVVQWKTRYVYTYICINTLADFLSHGKCIAQKCNLSRNSRVLPNPLDNPFATKML